MVKTDFYSAVFKKTIILMLAYLVGNSMNYFDRILLYPLVGGTSVSLYYVATVFGKVLNLLIAPINMVILSYLSKKNQISQKEIFVCFAGLVGLGAIFVAISVGAAPIILKILYPDYLNKVINLVPIATCSAVLMACTSLFKTLSMRFVSEKYIFITEIIYMVAYFGLGILFLHLFSLVGFCFATTIAASIRFIFFLFGLLAVNDKR
jgi:O-antigen/teichoic acid export membrane protein